MNYTLHNANCTELFGYFELNAFRSSNHNPIVIGLQMEAGAPKIVVGPLRRNWVLHSISGQSSAVEFADNLTQPDWQVRRVAVADETGRFEFLDSNPTSPAGFY